MQVPVCVLLERLAAYPCEAHISQAVERTVTGVSLLPEDARPLERDRLYVAPLSMAAARLARQPEGLFVCVEDGPGEVPAGAVLVRGEARLNTVFNLLQDALIAVQSWRQKLKELVFQGGNPQNLLDASEHLLPNCVNITDSNMRRIAATKHFPADDQTSVALRENGFHPRETVRLFCETNRFELWNAKEFYVDTSYQFSKYPLVGKVFRFQGTYFTHSVMTCDVQPPTPGVIALYRIFLDCLAMLVVKGWEKVEAFTHVYDSFLADVLTGNLTEPDIIEKQAKYAGIAAKGTYVLVNVLVEPAGNYSVGRIGYEIGSLFPRGKLMRFRDSILLFNLLDDAFFQEQFQQMRAALRPVLSEYSLACGISSRFDHLAQSAVAYRQTRAVLGAIRKCYSAACPLRESCVKEDCFHLDQPDYSFRDCYEYCALDLTDETISLCKHSFYFDVLTALYRYDREHKINNMQLLRVYIRCERSLTATSQRMHMHRNNVAYRIKRIEEMTGIDLENPDERFRLQVAYAQFNAIKGQLLPEIT